MLHDIGTSGARANEIFTTTLNTTIFKVLVGGHNLIEHSSNSTSFRNTSNVVIMAIDHADGHIDFFNTSGTRTLRINANSTDATTESPFNFSIATLPAVSYLGNLDEGDLYRANGFLKVKE